MPAPNPVRELIERNLLDLDPYGTYQGKVQLFENFRQRPVLATTLDPLNITPASVQLLTGANRDWNVEGTNADDANSTLNADGGVQLDTAGGDDDQMILVRADPINLITQSLWTALNWVRAPRFEAIIDIPQLDNFLFQVGFSLTPTLDVATDDDQVKFQYSSEGAVSTTNWTIIQSIDGVDTETDTGVAVEIDQSIRLAVEINTNEIPRFLIDGIKVFTGPSMATAGSFPTVLPFLGGQALEAAPKTYFARALRGSRDWRFFA